MMHIPTLHTLIPANSFHSNAWQHAIFYDFSTGSIFWNRAVVVRLPKSVADSPEEAMLYLLQKEAVVLEIWEPSGENHADTAEAFINAVITGGRFRNYSGEKVSTESFWEKYSATIESLRTEPDFEFSVNGVARNYFDLLNPSNILHVTCFDNSWQEQNFFIETTDSWFLYHWSTAA